MANHVVSLADRLKERRSELGISQAQAARELDVARTAYRLWEMDAAKPAPDRWRLISRWLGISVVSLLLAEELVSEEEASINATIAGQFARTGRQWDAVGADFPGDFFQQARRQLAQGVEGGHATSDQAGLLERMLDRMEADSGRAQTLRWQPTELRRNIPLDGTAPRTARDSVRFVATGIPGRLLDDARLLTSDLVTNAVVRGEAAGTLGLQVVVEDDRLRVEVWESGRGVAEPRGADASNADYLKLLPTIAARWGGGHEGDFYVTWFELDLPAPGVA